MKGREGKSVCKRAREGKGVCRRGREGKGSVREEGKEKKVKGRGV